MYFLLFRAGIATSSSGVRRLDKPELRFFATLTACRSPWTSLASRASDGTIHTRQVTLVSGLVNAFFPFFAFPFRFLGDRYLTTKFLVPVTATTQL